jgi:hypothetical protein
MPGLTGDAGLGLAIEVPTMISDPRLLAGWNQRAHPFVWTKHQKNPQESEP